MMAIPEAERQRVIERLAVLAAAFPNWHPTDETVEAYVVTLVDLDPLMLEAAVLDLLGRPLEFFPSPGQVRDAAFALVDNRPSPGDAWALVLSEIRRGVGYPQPGLRSVADVPPEVEDAVRAVGGWVALGQSENAVADRARFLAAYEQALSKARSLDRMLPAVRESVAALTARLASPALAAPKEAPVDGTSERT